MNKRKEYWKYDGCDSLAEHIIELCGTRVLRYYIPSHHEWYDDKGNIDDARKFFLSGRYRYHQLSKSDLVLELI